MNRDIQKKLKDNSAKIKEKFRVKEIGIFGSCIKGNKKRIKDVDILVEFEKDGETFDNYMELKFFLGKLLKKKVDLVLKDALKDRLKSYILSEVVYV